MCKKIMTKTRIFDLSKAFDNIMFNLYKAPNGRGLRQTLKEVLI